MTIFWWMAASLAIVAVSIGTVLTRTTEGRAVFNLNPLETNERFQHGLKGVD